MKKIYLLILPAIFLVACSGYNVIYENETIVINHKKCPIKIEFPKYEFKEQTATSGTEKDEGYFMFSDNSDDVNVSFFVEKASKFDKVELYRDLALAGTLKGPVRVRDVKKINLPTVALAEYFVPEFFGVVSNQKNINVHYLVDNYWVDMHISQTGFNGLSKEKIESIIKNTKVSYNNDVKIYKSATDSIKAKYNLKCARAAFNYLTKHYDLVKQYSQEIMDDTVSVKYIAPDAYKVLTDNLGMSYGITGELDKAENLYLKAISKGENFAMYYYNLACVYAEKKNTEKALEYLRLAVKYKKNILKGEKFPNPNFDNSFKGIKDNPEFIKIVS